MECTQSLRNDTSALESMKPSSLPYRCSCNLGILRSLWKLPWPLTRLNWLGKSLDCWFLTCQLQSCSGHDCRAQPRNLNCLPASWVSILSCKAERRRLMFRPGWERLSRLIWLSFHTYHSAFIANSFLSRCLYLRQSSEGPKSPPKTKTHQPLDQSYPWCLLETFHLECSHWPNCYQRHLLLSKWKHFQGCKDLNANQFEWY